MSLFRNNTKHRAFIDTLLTGCVSNKTDYVGLIWHLRTKGEPRRNKMRLREYLIKRDVGRDNASLA